MENKRVNYSDAEKNLLPELVRKNLVIDNKIATKTAAIEEQKRIAWRDTAHTYNSKEYM